MQELNDLIITNQLQDNPASDLVGLKFILSEEKQFYNNTKTLNEKAVELQELSNDNNQETLCRTMPQMRLRY